MFSKLFEPVKIGNMELKNRLIMSGINLNYAREDGAVTPRLIRFYSERAKGGAAMVQTGICYIDPQGKFFPNQMGIYDDKLVPGLRELVKSIQQYGAKAVVQLCHVGNCSRSAVTGSLPVSSSEVPSRFSGEKPHSLTIPEIKVVVEKFAAGARRAREAGADGVDLQSAIGYLITQFLSPHFNKRTDEYGGDIYGRMKFMLEVLQAVRREVGKDFAILTRISGDEFTPDGNTLEDGKIIAKTLEANGIDSINVIPGLHDAPKSLVYMDVPPGAFVYQAEEVKKVVKKVPIIASNRINTPELADKIIREGKADLVTMGRALIADPELPLKAQQGRVDEIRPCIACNQGCLDRMFGLSADVLCLMNPAAGREEEFEIKRAAKPKKVLVIGGGPAGLEAAIVAAQRGHLVTLWEREKDLGGQARLAAVPPYKQEVEKVARFYSNQIGKLGIQTKLGKEATAEEVLAAKPDAVVVATGAEPYVPQVPGITQKNVVNAWDILSGKAKAGQNVIVAGGGMVGVETAEFLASQGKKVTVIEMLNKIAADIGATTRWIILERVQKLGIPLLTQTKLVRIEGNKVVTDKNGQEQVLTADTVVLALGVVSNKKLAEQLQGKVECYTVGDCVQPRKMIDAIYEGSVAARKI